VAAAPPHVELPVPDDTHVFDSPLKELKLEELRRLRELRELAMRSARALGVLRKIAQDPGLFDGNDRREKVEKEKLVQAAQPPMSYAAAQTVRRIAAQVDHKGKDSMLRGEFYY
jgi:hypothetical protein